MTTEHNDSLPSLLRDRVGRPIRVYPGLVGIAPGVNLSSAVLLSQAIYWSERAPSGGWFFKSRADWQSETGLTRREQESARRALREAGILQERRSGNPAKLWFFVDSERLIALLAHPENDPETACEMAQNVPSKMAQNVPSSRRKTYQLDGTERTNLSVQNAPTTNTVTTSLTTASTTAGARTCIRTRKSADLQAPAVVPAREPAAPMVAMGGLFGEEQEPSCSASQDMSEELPTPESATQPAGDMTQSENGFAALEIDIDPTDPTGARVCVAAPRKNASQPSSQAPPQAGRQAPSAPVSPSQGSPSPVAPSPATATMDWDAAAAALRGRRAETARYVASTLREADSNPTRRHWRAEITKRLLQRSEESPLHEPAAYAAAMLRGWLRGEGHPEIPFEMTADAHRVSHDPGYWRYRARLAADRVEALARRGDEDGVIAAEAEQAQAMENLRRAEARLGLRPAPEPAYLSPDEISESFSAMRAKIEAIDREERERRELAREEVAA